MRFKPFFRRSTPSALNEERYVGPRHFIMSSSMPPAVVTTAETCECWRRYRSTERNPDEMRFEVYPRNIVVLTDGSEGSRQLRYADVSLEFNVE